MHNNTLFYKTVDFAPFQNTLSMLQSVLGGNTNERKKKMLKRNLLYAVYDLDLKLLRKYIRDFCFFFSCITYFLSHYSINTCFLLLLPLETIPLWKNQFVLLFFDIIIFFSLSLALNCLELVTCVIIVFVLYGSVKYACFNTEKEEKRTKKPHHYRNLISLVKG